ncbi:MAG: periplasmic heavy metal sensor [Sphingomonadales bacterium]|nr:MAG: periplasmic heavy metal sensor [Sphingomonadales bacterium]
MKLTRILPLALVAFVMAIAGVLLTRTLLPAPVAPETALHKLIHDELDLDAAQHAKIEALEKSFAERRNALEAEMRADNVRLAGAIQNEHGYGPGVASAIDASHQAMGELQKETVQHLFAMRGVLRPDQAARFDATVTKALTAAGQ